MAKYCKELLEGSSCLFREKLYLHNSTAHNTFCI